MSLLLLLVLWSCPSGFTRYLNKFELFAATILSYHTFIFVTGGILVLLNRDIVVFLSLKMSSSSMLNLFFWLCDSSLHLFMWK